MTTPSTPELTIRLSSNTTLPLPTPQRLAPATSTPLPLSRSHTHKLPLAANPTQRPSESDNVETAPRGPKRFRTNTNFGTDPVVVGIDKRYSCKILGEYISDDAKPDPKGDIDCPDPGGEGGGVGDNEDGDGVNDDAGSVAVAGASTTHFPSVWVSATLNTFRPHCSRISLSLRSSIHPFGASNVLVVLVVITDIEGRSASCEVASSGSASMSVSVSSTAGVFVEMTSSVAPTLQCFG